MSSCLPLLVMHDCRSTPWHLTGGLPSRKRWRTATRHWWRCCYPMAPSSIRWALLLSSRAASLSLSLSLSSLSLLARCCSTHFLCSLWYSTHALFLLSLFALLLQHALPLLALLLHARTLSVRSAAAALTLSARSAAARTHSLCSLCCCTHTLSLSLLALLLHTLSPCSHCCCSVCPLYCSLSLCLSRFLLSLSLRANHDTDAFRAASSAPTMRLAADHFGIGIWR